MPSPAPIILFPVNVFANMLAANASNNIQRTPPFCSVASFLFVSLIPIISNPDSSSYLTIFIISSISSFEIINAVVCKAKSEERPDP